MALTKTRQIDRIEILRDGVIQIREVTEIRDDNELLAERYHRYVHVPTDNLIDIPNPRLRNICQTVWTPAVIAVYIATLPSKPA